MRYKNATFAIAIIFGAILLGFLLSTGLIQKTAVTVFERFEREVHGYLEYHTFMLQRPARHYFLLPDGGYTAEVVKGRLGPAGIAVVFGSALFNSLFQPIFLCPLTPQTVFSYILFPFFLYGAVKYFRKFPILIIFFLFMSVYNALYGAVVEALVRHRMSCELVYFMIGLAGLTSLITKRSLS